MAVRSGVRKGWRTVPVYLGLALVVLVSVAACTAALAIPNFTITAYQGAEELGGEQVTVQELLNEGKPVVLNFWAGACPPCRAEMPDFQRVYDRRHHAVTIIGVDVGPYLNLGRAKRARRS